jgi:hypothetical protein
VPVPAFLPLLRRIALGLDPARAVARLSHFDEARGFANYALTCRAAGERAAQCEATAVSHDLAAFGVCRIDVMPAGDALSIRERLGPLPVQPPRADDVDFTDRLEMPADFEREVLEGILSPSVAAEVERRFGSPFLVYNMHVTRLRPGTVSKRSLLWHCDTGPSDHLKLLLYLDDSEETGGNTNFIDRAASDAFLRAGYTFGPLRRRRGDLTALGRRFGIRFQPRHWRLRPGQGLLFEPSRVLHRGVVPTGAARHIVTLLLLPSPTPWHSHSDMPGRRLGLDFGFPPSAADLLRST